MLLLCGSGSNPSKHGIEHCPSISDYWQCRGQCYMVRTWRMSSKSRAASFFISETFVAKERIVDAPKPGTRLKLEDPPVSDLHVKWHAQEYFSSSLSIRLSGDVSRMRIRCVKIAFHTPSSNSCMRSTTSRANTLGTRSENAFYTQDECVYTTAETHTHRRWHT